MTENTTNNKRRIPTGEDFMKDKKIFDLLYVKLQIESSWTEGETHRYIAKNDINRTVWGSDLKITAPTLRARFKTLIQKGYIEEYKSADGKEYYRLPQKDCFYSLIPRETLTFLLNTTNEDVIKVYCLLENLYRTYEGSAYFTKINLLTSIGYSPSSRNNQRMYQKINHILLALEKFGLIEYEEKYETLNGSTIAKQYIKNISYAVKAK